MALQHSIWESGAAGSYSAPGPTIGRTTTEDGVTQTFAGYPLKIVAARLSNTAEAFATGNIMYQVFDAGYEMTDPINLVGKATIIILRVKHRAITLVCM